MNSLNSVEKAFLLEIAQKEEWRSILTKLKRTSNLKYKKKGDEESKIHDWIYESGRSEENEKILSILTNGEFHE